MSERKVVHLQNEGIETVRNAGVEEASDLLRLYLKNKGTVWERFPQTFYVPEQPVIRKDAQALGITGEGDLLGGIIDDPHHAGKAVLHEAIGGAPGWHKSEFATLMKENVLPGFTAFDEAGAKEAFVALKEGLGADTVRLKDPREAGGMGQFAVRETDALPEVLSGMYGENLDALAEYGVVLEVNLEKPEELIVGTLAVGQETYSYYGTKKKSNDTSIICLKIIKGGFTHLLKESTSEETHQAVELAASAMEHYQQALGVTAHRAVFDVVRGQSGGREYLGVTDTSMRVTGSWHAELPGVNRLSLLPRKRDTVIAIGRIGLMQSNNESRWLQDDENYELVRYSSETGLSRYASVHYIGW